MKLKTVAYTSALVGCLSGQGFAQEDLEVFGYFQGFAQYSDNRGLVAGPKESLSLKNQQLNVFFAKDLGSDFRALVNLEWANNYDSKDGIGGARVEEAWMSWQPSDLFRLRLGKHIPTFNGFNTIKNKMPLHPFVLRPLIYEASISTKYLDLSAWAPREAFVSVDGVVEMSDEMSFDYSLFLGNSDFTVKDFGGADTKVGKSVGARLGVEHSDLGLKLGVTGTMDYEVFTELSTMIDEVKAKTLENAPFNTFKADDLEGMTKFIDGSVAQIDGGILQYDAGIATIDSGLVKLAAGLEQLEAAKGALDEGTYQTQKATLEGTQTATLKAKEDTEAERQGLVDQKNGLNDLKKVLIAAENGLPSVDRFRIGGDFSYEPEFGLVVKAEYVHVAYSGDELEEVAEVSKSLGNVANSTMSTYEGRDFISLMIGQKFLEDYFVYGLYSKLTNGLFIDDLEKGLMTYGGGLTYSPIFNVTLKAQVAAYGIQKSVGFDMEYGDNSKLYNYYFGTSVFF